MVLLQVGFHAGLCRKYASRVRRFMFTVLQQFASIIASNYYSLSLGISAVLFFREEGQLKLESTLGNSGIVSSQLSAGRVLGSQHKDRISRFCQ